MGRPFSPIAIAIPHITTIEPSSFYPTVSEQPLLCNNLAKILRGLPDTILKLYFWFPTQKAFSSRDIRPAHLRIVGWKRTFLNDTLGTGNFQNDLGNATNRKFSGIPDIDRIMNAVQDSVGLLSEELRTISAFRHRLV